MSSSEASSSVSVSSNSNSTGGSATEVSFTLRQSPGSPLRPGRPEIGSPRKLPHCRECRRPMKGHHKYADCPRVKAQARRLQARAQFHEKLKKLRAGADVVKGSYEEIWNLAQEAEDLRYKTCVVKGGKSAGNQDGAWLVFGEDGRAVQNMGSELRKTLKAGRWGGRGGEMGLEDFQFPRGSRRRPDLAAGLVQRWEGSGKGLRTSQRLTIATTVTTRPISRGRSTFQRGWGKPRTSTSSPALPPIVYPERLRAEIMHSDSRS